MVGVDTHDVVELGDRPIGPVRARSRSGARDLLCAAARNTATAYPCSNSVASLTSNVGERHRVGHARVQRCIAVFMRRLFSLELRVNVGLRACARSGRRARPSLRSGSRGGSCPRCPPQSRACPLRSRCAPPVFASQPGSTNTWQVAQAHCPPQSPSMPGMPLSTAPRMTVEPTGTSTTCSRPLCSM